MRLSRRGRAARASAERTPPSDLVIPAGEIVTVRAYAGSRADEEPRAVVIGGREVPVEEVEWRAVQEREGERRRVFVVRLEGTRVRLAYVESSSLWEIERILDPGDGAARGPGGS